MIKYITAVFFLSCVFLLQDIYASSAGAVIFPLLKINTAANAAALGEINGLVSAQTTINNPSALPWINSREISYQHLSYFQNTTLSVLTYISPIDDKKALGFSFGYLGTGGLKKTEYNAAAPDLYIEKGSFNFSDMMLNVSYGRKSSYDFSYGISLKAVRESIDGVSSTGFMMSLSGLFFPNEKVSVGFGLFNLGPQVKGYSLPSGGYFNIGKKVSRELFWTGEVAGYSDNIMELHSGIEYYMSRIFLLRFGYKYMLEDQGLGDFPEVGFTAGLGMSVKGILIDYAWVPYGDLGQTHRLTLAMSLEK